MEYIAIGIMILCFPPVFILWARCASMIYSKIEAKKDRINMRADLYSLSYDEDKKLVKELFKDKTRLSYQADIFLKAIEESKWHHKELNKRRCIIERVFAYDYEEMLYQIFAPSGSGLSKDEIIKRISEIKQISNTEAKKIFDILVEHKLVVGTDKVNNYELTSMLKKGGFEGPYWYSVSILDMNLQKWKKENNYPLMDGKNNKVKSEITKVSVNDTSEDSGIEEDDYHIDKDELWYEKESKKREWIKERVFAYDYEEMLYQIFAPSATCLSTVFYSDFNGINKDEIIDKISEIKHISYTKAKKIFDILVEHKLLNKSYKQPNNYRLCSMLETSSYSHSDFKFDNCWYIVTVLDMNLDKWMKMHNHNNYIICDY